MHVKGGKNLNFGPPDESVVEEYRKNGNVPAGRLGATSTKRAEYERSLNGSCDDVVCKERGASSHYRGVSWYAARQIWKASIQVNRKKEYIGRFETEEEAARAYNKRATELRGSDAVLNIVPDTVTRFPSAEMLANSLNEEDVPKRSLKRRSGGSDSDSSDLAIDIKASSIPHSDVPRKKSRTDDDTSGISNSFIPPTPTIPNINQTPHISRAPSEVDTLTRGIMSFDAEELEAAVGGNFFNIGMTPGFLSPPTSQQLGRNQNNFESVPLPLSAPSTSTRSLGGLGGGMTPMLQNLFDSPAEKDIPASFTPSDNLPRSIPRSHRKTLLPAAYSLNS